MLYQDQMEAPVYVPRPKISHKYNDKFDESDADEDMAESQEEPYSLEDEKEDSDDKRDEEKRDDEKRDEEKKDDERGKWRSWSTRSESSWRKEKK